MKFIRKYYSKYELYFRNSFLYFSSTLVSAFIAIILNPFMAKNLSPEDYAIIGYFNSFNTAMLPIMNFSLITYYLRNYYKIDNERRRVVSDTILVTLLVYGLIILFISFGVFYIYSKSTDLSFPVYPYVLLAFAPVYFNNFITMYLVKCRMERKAGQYSKIIIINSVFASLLAILLVVIYKYGAVGKMSSLAIATLILGVYCFKQMLSKFQFDLSIVKDALKFGWPLSLSAIFWYFLSGVDVAMLEKLRNSYTLGYYNVALQISGYFALVYTAIAQAFEPDVYKAIADNNKRRLFKIIGGIIVFNAIPNLLFICFTPFIINVLTYGRYTESTEFARILAIKNITMTFYYSLITVIIGYGFTKSELIIRVVGAAICYCLFRVLISNFEFYGAAWGQVLSFVFLSIICVVFLFIKSGKLQKNIIGS